MWASWICVCTASYVIISWNDRNIVQIMHEFLLQFTVPIVINVTPYKVEDHMDKGVTEGDRSF